MDEYDDDYYFDEAEHYRAGAKRSKAGLTRNGAMKLSEFKRRYKYDSRTKTISWGGKRIKVDIDIYKDPDYRNIAAMQYGNTEPYVELNQNFFNHLDDMEQKGVLAHEVFHIKAHLPAGHNNADLRITNEELYNKALRNTMREMMGDDISDSDMRDAVKKYGFGYKNYKNRSVKELKQDIRKNEKEIKNRLNYVKSASKYAKGGHSNTNEFEADAYASNKVGSKTFLKGLKKTYDRLILSSVLDKCDFDKNHPLARRKLRAVITNRVREIERDGDEDEKELLKEIRRTHGGNLVDKFLNIAMKEADYSERKEVLNDPKLCKIRKQGYRD